MKLSSPLLILFGSAHIANAENLDLYVREKFTGECLSSCEEGGGCFLKTRAFFVGGSCFNRSDQKASVYGELDDGLVCRQDFRVSCDFEVSAFSATEEAECKDSWRVDECLDDERMTKLSGWCTMSNAPTGEFVTPLLTLREYDGVDACGSSDYAHLMLADEGGACSALSFPTEDGTYVTGSRRVSCDGDVFRASRYESDDCTGEAARTYTDGSSGACPEDSEDERIYTNNCGAPTIYCKPSPFFAEGSEEVVIEAAEAKEVATTDDIDEVLDADTANEFIPKIEPLQKTDYSAAGHAASTSGIFAMVIVLTSWIV